MKFHMPFIIVVFGIGLITSTVSAQDQIDYTEMVEDLKVMCRIVDETMDETFENDYVKGGFFRRGGCQHLYLKGYGAMFLLDVRFPVAKKKMRIVKTEKKTDLWEKHEREVRHQSHPEEAAWVVDKNESYRKEKVDKLKEQIAYLVGEYGSHIGQVALDDTISFVVFGFSDHTVDLDVGLDFEWHIVGDAVQHAQAILEQPKVIRVIEKEILEKHRKKIEELAEKVNQDSNEKVISQKGKTIIIEEKQNEEMADSQPKEGKRHRMLIPPMPPNFPQRFRGKPATTLILTFKRSQLEGKNGTDWEALLEAAEIVEY